MKTTVSNNITMPALLLPSMIKVAQENDIDALALFAEHGIDFQTISMEKGRIPVDLLCDVILALTEATQNPTLGLSLARHFSYEYINEIDTFLLTAGKLLDGFEAFRWINQLIGSIMSLQYISDGETFTAKVDYIQGTPEPVERALAESSFSMINQFGMQRAGARFKIERLVFKHADRSSVPIYQNVFNCPISLGGRCYEISFEQSLLDEPLQQTSQALNSLARHQVEQRLVSIIGDKSLRQELFDLLIQHPYLMQAGIDTIAPRFFMTPRTLQRRLKQENCTLSRISTEVKQELSTRLLEGKLSLEHISDVLGFSDRRSFTRAFRQWFSITPSAYRKTAKT